MSLSDLFRFVQETKQFHLKRKDMEVREIGGQIFANDHHAGYKTFERSVICH